MLQLVVPIGIQAIIGFVLGATMVTSIYVLIIVVVMAVLGAGLLQINQMKINEKIQQKIFVSFALQFAEKIPKIDIYKSINYYLPERLNRFFDTHSVQKGLTYLILDIPAAIIQIFLGVLLLAFYHPVFIGFGAMLIVMLWFIVKYSGNNGMITSLDESDQKYRTVAWFQEIAKAIKSFKNSQDSTLDIARTDHHLVNYIAARTAHFKVLVLQYRVLVGFKVIITTTLLSAGVFLLINQKLNIGEFIAAEIVILMIIASTEKIIKSLENVYDVATGLIKLQSFTDADNDIDGTLEFKDTKIALDIKELSFSFQDGRKILKNIDLKIPAGAVVCLTGEEGSGKSTLLKILSNTYTNYDGNILFNGIPAQNYRLETLRKHTGIYFGQGDIFAGSILENINMGRSEITGEVVMAMASNVGMSGIFEHFPMGFETQVLNNGAALPSTTKQKILILRALCHQPKLLILQNPLVGLHEDVRIPLVKYILSLSGKCTVIIASSNAEFAKQCDFELMLKNGKGKLTQNIRN